MKELNCTPAKNITGEITVESFYNTFAKKDENAATEAFKKLQFRFQRCKLVRKKKLIKERTKLKEAVFIVGHSAIKKINGYLLTKSINQKFLVKVRPFTTAKTIDMYDYLKRTLRDFGTSRLLRDTDTNDLSLNKASNEIAEEIKSC